VTQSFDLPQLKTSHFAWLILLYSFPHTVSIRGADNVDEVALEVIRGKPLDYDWKRHGLRLHIPANALDAKSSPMIMRIQASLSGQFKLPDDMELVSGVYWISFPAKSLVQPVTLELQHCACLQQNEQSHLSFVISKCNQKTLPYQFEPLDGGVFTTNSDYGAVELCHFCGVAVVEEKSGKKNYVALTYYIQDRFTRTTWVMHFTIIRNLDLCLQVDVSM